jgi:hypothetical protein
VYGFGTGSCSFSGFQPANLRFDKTANFKATFPKIQFWESRGCLKNSIFKQQALETSKMRSIETHRISCKTCPISSRVIEQAHMPEHLE